MPNPVETTERSERRRPVVLESVFGAQALEAAGVVVENGVVRTSNKTGYMRTFLPEYSRKLVSAPWPDGWRFLEIGGGVGNVIKSALDCGAREIVAVDVEPSHLEMMQRLIAGTLAQHPEAAFDTIVDSLPALETLQDRRFERILCAQVLHYLSPDQFDPALARLKALLPPGGELTITVGTPFIGVYESFLPIYEERRERGDIFAGYMEDARQFHPNGANHHPGSYLFFGPEDLGEACRRAGFEVLECGFEDQKTNGRNAAGTVVRRPD